MTLTRDRKAELLSAARLFDGVDADGMDRIAAVAVQVDFPARPRHRPAGRDRDRLLRRRRWRGPRRARRRDDRDAGPGRLLRRAVGPRRASRATPRSWPSGRRPAWPSRPGISRRSSSRSRRSPWRSCAAWPTRLRELTEADPALIRRRSRRDDRADAAPSPGPITFLFSDIEGSTPLEQRRRDATATPRSSSATGRSCARRSTPTAATSRAPRATRSSSPSDEATAAVAAAVAGQRGAARPSRGRTASTSASGWASTPASRGVRDRRGAVADRRRHQPGGADRGGRPRRPDPGVAADARRCSSDRPGRRRLRCATSASTGSRTCAPRSASSRSSPTACRPSSRRSARSMPARTTCRPS